MDSEHSSLYMVIRLKQLLLLPQSAPSGSQSADVNAGEKRRAGGEEQGAKSKERRAKSKEQRARSKEQSM